ncbi:hypothetical protein ACODM8_18105 [Vibrio ostreicida]|uniref:Uncharacterized protein n=1 Tax=Vibrio ostreicida TaxID=526588 RepID=A0ABT8C2V5_9VIBR|nr:hypothetical protein [Vibrio ostreicida]MDN3611810.1 hypothetical protein [Vibrio ostreicida]MDN3612657.1 hypothetical protein [Vibrio ostreicida]MDN3612683.1 hypothetical protein [Vibrio ostreicida]NPD09624.1 hypothetical protein [Vibrio ostreicida]
MSVILKLGQWFIFLPTIGFFSYILRPVLMVILIPGGLALLCILGGKEARQPLVAMLLGDRRRQTAPSKPLKP